MPQIDLWQALAVIVPLVSLAFVAVNSSRNRKQDTSAQIAQMTQLITKLESIGDDVKELKAEFKNIREEMGKIREDVTILKTNESTMWKRIDEIKAKIGL